jgi:hypothetical protein
MTAEARSTGFSGELGERLDNVPLDEVDDPPEYFDRGFWDEWPKVFDGDDHVELDVHVHVGMRWPEGENTYCCALVEGVRIGKRHLRGGDARRRDTAEVLAAEDVQVDALMLVCVVQPGQNGERVAIADHRLEERGIVVQPRRLQRLDQCPCVLGDVAQAGVPVTSRF